MGRFEPQCPDGVVHREDLAFDVGLDAAVAGVKSVPPGPLGDLPIVLRKVDVLGLEQDVLAAVPHQLREPLQGAPAETGIPVLREDGVVVEETGIAVRGLNEEGVAAKRVERVGLVRTGTVLRVRAYIAHVLKDADGEVTVVRPHAGYALPGLHLVGGEVVLQVPTEDCVGLFL